MATGTIDLGPVIGPRGPAGADGITSFNGRTGAITPQVGDYTPELVGSVPTVGKGVNLLDNWYFADPVNQRGKKEYTSDVPIYTVDRWYIHNLPRAALEDDGILLHCIPNTYGDFSQRVEFNNHKRQLYTLSVMVESVTGDWYMQVEQNENYLGTVDLTGKGLFSSTVELQESDVLNFRICANQTNTSTNALKVSAAKFEPGSVQTMARKEGDTWVLNDPPPNKALEMAKCLRYQNFGPIYGRKIWTHEQNAAGAFFPTPVTMRATPALNGNIVFQKDGSLDNYPVTPTTIMLINNGIYVYFYDSGIDFSDVNFFVLNQGSGFDANP